MELGIGVIDRFGKNIQMLCIPFKQRLFLTGADLAFFPRGGGGGV